MRWWCLARALFELVELGFEDLRCVSEAAIGEQVLGELAGRALIAGIEAQGAVKVLLGAFDVVVVEADLSCISPHRGSAHAVLLLGSAKLIQCCETRLVTPLAQSCLQFAIEVDILRLFGKCLEPRVGPLGVVAACGRVARHWQKLP